VKLKISEVRQDTFLFITILINSVYKKWPESGDADR